ncbi:MAG: radical SAM protein [Bacteroidales bacterium]|nr:radical SAM protein [Bacteroidales bacterium]
MLREDTVFGPIFSRRLGSSLGINLLPREGKVCNFDCIYCECGWNKDGLQDRTLPSARDVEEALEAKLRECKAAGTPIDSITFSGDGEPTLNPEFAAIIDITIRLRDLYYPSAKVSVLTNATRCGEPGIFEALRKIDNPILKLDAPTDEEVALINRPVGEYHVKDVVASMARFEGNFILQTMFLRGPGWATEDWVQGWMDIVRRLKPREIQVYTIDRETPMKGLSKYTAEEMRSLVQPLTDEGFKLQIKA